MSTLKDNVQDPDYAIAGPSRQQKTFEETGNFLDLFSNFYDAEIKRQLLIF